MAQLSIVKPKTAIEKRTRTTVDTIMITPERMAKWKMPSGQRPLRENQKVKDAATKIQEDGGVIPGILTIGIFEDTYWIIDGQHRLHAFKLTALTEIVIGKIAKRSISLKNVEQCEPDVSPLGHARQLVKIKQGLETEIAKQVTGFIRESKFKVTTQIQDQQVRVTGKSRDDLQSVIAAVRAKDFPVALQFTNFRD